jgi:hypothetical protein
VASRIDLRDRDANLRRKFGAALTYFPVEVTRLNGDVVPALFTDGAIREAVERARANPEDCPPPEGYFSRLWAALLGR